MIGYTKHFNTIVIGVGGMGSATCYQLARRGQRVLGLERFDIPHDLGSSHGYTRIIRLAYYEHPSYVMLLKRAYELWDEMEKKSRKKLFYKTGSIDAGPADSWVFKGSLRSCVEHDLPHEVLTGIEMEERFPGYRLPHDLMAVYQPDGGFLLPEKATVAYVQAAQALGAEIHGREEVLEWEPAGDGVRVVTERAEYSADSLVITAGSWDAHLLPFLNGLAVPERQVLAWLQPEKPEYFTPERFPVFNVLVEEGRYYGFPVFGVPGFKFGKYHHFEERGMPEYLDLDVTREDEDMLREFAARYFPDGAGPVMTLKACMFTNSPDKHFIIDLHPQHPQVSFAAGFSGHGYKFASVIGEVMADLAERQDSRHDIRLFSLARLTGQMSALHAQDAIGRRAHGDAMRAPRLFTPRRALSGGRTRATPAPHQRREVTSRRRTRGAARGAAYRRAQPGEYGHEHGYYEDTTDPLYWERDSIKPFWS